MFEYFLSDYCDFIIIQIKINITNSQTLYHQIVIKAISHQLSATNKNMAINQGKKWQKMDKSQGYL